MRELRYTLLSDGSSDRALLPILTWLLRQRLPESAVQSVWADLRRLPAPPRGLVNRINAAVELYPCDLLFIHRDAEGPSRDQRVSEILATRHGSRHPDLPTVCVVPVRMTEAWLLIDEAAIRRAAGNPNGRVPLDIPRLRDLERLADPKATLRELLVTASELSARRRSRLRVAQCALRVSEHVGDFSPLRHLPAFAAVEDEARSVIHEQGWQPSR